MKDFFDAIWSVLGMALAAAFVFGGAAGVLYWAWRGDLWQTVLSGMIPLYGPISIIGDLFFH